MIKKHPVVLVVDDQPEVRRAVSMQLRTRGLIVFEASGGSEALEIINSTLVDLALTDVDMPTMSGLAMVRRLRARGVNLPIITMSGDPTHRTECLRSGANAFFDKPLNADNVMDELFELLRS